MPSENSGPPPARRVTPPPPPQSESVQAARAAAARAAARAAAQRAETEKEARRLKSAREAAARSAAAKKAAIPNVREGRTSISPPTTPYVGHYGQQRPPPTPPPPTPPPRSTKNDSSTTPPKVIDTPIEIPQFMEPTPEPVASIVPSPVRIAARNVFDISSLVPQFDAEQIQKLLFENISAIELSIVERHDTIEGINQRYSIISNLSEVRKKYDISKQLSIMDKFNPLTSIFTINIKDKIPQEDYIRLQKLDSTYQYLDENNKIVTRQKGYFYIDTNGDLVIELINLERNQQVEVLIDTNGTIYNIEKVES
jgi:hypothetical protein